LHSSFYLHNRVCYVRWRILILFLYIRFHLKYFKQHFVWNLLFDCRIYILKTLSGDKVSLNKYLWMSIFTEACLIYTCQYFTGRNSYFSCQNDRYLYSYYIASFVYEYMFIKCHFYGSVVYSFLFSFLFRKRANIFLKKN